MLTFQVETPPAPYDVLVERGILERAAHYVPAKAGKLFVVSTEDVWRHQCTRLEHSLAATPHEVLFLPGGEDQKRLAPVERLAEEMVRRGGDRTSVVVAFGGGIVTDMAGFLAAIFMRGIPVVQVPTTLLAQVDASIGGKTGVNLEIGKNLIGSFHQPLAVLVDPSVLDTLPDREYRAGLYEILKAGVIRSEPLFRTPSPAIWPSSRSRWPPRIPLDRCSPSQTTPHVDQISIPIAGRKPTADSSLSSRVELLVHVHPNHPRETRHQRHERQIRDEGRPDRHIERPAREFPYQQDEQHHRRDRQSVTHIHCA
jgi:hypothetical protein